MRAFGLLGTVIVLAVGMYLYSSQIKTFQPQAVGAKGEDPVNITGVKNDLISIGNAERGYMASQGKYASLDELISGNYVTIRSERPPYIYNVEASGTSFRATATRTTKGSPAQLWIGDDMQVQSSD
jgi:hypothetical protein